MALTKTSNPSSTEASGGSEDEEIAADATAESDEGVEEAVVSVALEDVEDPPSEADEDVEDAEGRLELTAGEVVEDAEGNGDESVEASCFLEGRPRGGHSKGSRWEGIEVSSPVEAGRRC